MVTFPSIVTLFCLFKGALPFCLKKWIKINDSEKHDLPEWNTHTYILYNDNLESVRIGSLPNTAWKEPQKN